MLDSLALLELARSLAEQAADLLRDAVGHAYEVDTKSSLTDMVSAADRASERLIAEGIRAAAMQGAAGFSPPHRSPLVAQKLGQIDDVSVSITSAGAT